MLREAIYLFAVLRTVTSILVPIANKESIKSFKYDVFEEICRSINLTLAVPGREYFNLPAEEELPQASIIYSNRLKLRIFSSYETIIYSTKYIEIQNNIIREEEIEDKKYEDEEYPTSANGEIEDEEIETERYINCKNPSTEPDDFLAFCKTIKDESRDESSICCARDDNDHLWIVAEDRRVITSPNTLYSKWPCGANSTFTVPEPIVYDEEVTTTPRYHSDLSMTCRYTDNEGNFWMADQNTTIFKNATCPYGSAHWKAIITFTCNVNNHSLDNSKCFECPNSRTCKAEWQGNDISACEGIEAIVPCGAGVNGPGRWTCGEHGAFIETQPYVMKCNLESMISRLASKGSLIIQLQPNDNLNLSNSYWDCFASARCSFDLEEEVSEMINKNQSSIEIFKYIENTLYERYINASKVIRSLNQTVDLLQQQNNRSLSIESFNQVIDSYCRSLGNITDTSQDMNETKLSQEEVINLLGVTEKLGFTLPRVISNRSEVLNYKRHFPVLLDKGLSLLISYAASIENGERFHEQIDSAGWSAQMTQTLIEKEDHMYGVVGTTIDSTRVSGNNNGTAVNSALLSFTISEFDSNFNATVIQPNEIIIFFNLSKKARGPKSKIIRRRLYDGEEKTFIEGSEMCSTFKNEAWIMESKPRNISDNMIMCQYTHLSVLAVLMESHEYEQDVFLEYLSIALSIISILSLLATVGNIFNEKKPQNVSYGIITAFQEGRVVKVNICVCLIVGHILLLTTMDQTHIFKPDLICRGFAVVLHFVFLAAFAWLGMEGIILYEKMTRIVHMSGNRSKKAVGAVYASVLLVIAMTELISYLTGVAAYGRPELCWLTTPYFNWAFIGPVIIIILGNLLSLTIALLKMFTKNESRLTQRRKSRWVQIRGMIGLSIIMGVTWMIGIIYFDSEVGVIIRYVFVILNGLQGFFIFVFWCFMQKYFENKKVVPEKRTELRR